MLKILPNITVGLSHILTPSYQTLLSYCSKEIEWMGGNNESQRGLSAAEYHNTSIRRDKAVTILKTRRTEVIF